VIVPVLVAPGLALTEYATVPLPVPLDPDVTVINALLLTAVYAQPPPVVTVKLPVEALPGTLELTGDSANVQAAWLTVNV